MLALPWSLMIKFIVLLRRKPTTSPEQFRRYLEEVHGPMAEELPGLRRYVRNFPAVDPRRSLPPWDAVIELYWDDRQSMETAWASEQGRATTADLEPFADLKTTSWSLVEEVVVREGS